MPSSKSVMGVICCYYRLISFYDVVLDLHKRKILRETGGHKWNNITRL